MVNYESIFIAEPNASDDEVAAFTKGFEEAVTGGSGTVLKVEKWGKRRLAYRIGRHEDGNYTLLYLNCPPAAVKELERRYRMNDRIIKYLTVRVDENIPDTKPTEAGTASEDRPVETLEAE